jgi:hypothetical protein
MKDRLTSSTVTMVGFGITAIPIIFGCPAGAERLTFGLIMLNSGRPLSPKSVSYGVQHGDCVTDH